MESGAKRMNWEGFAVLMAAYWLGVATTLGAIYCRGRRSGRAGAKRPSAFHVDPGTGVVTIGSALWL